MKVFRIAAARLARTRKEAFSGRGGLLAPGRWHSAGRLVVYTAESLSLAALEILVHLKQTHHLRPFNAFTAEIPDELILKPSSYPTHWQTRLSASRTFGDHWLEARTTPALLVPTVLTPGEWNVVLNPAHPQFSLDWIVDGPRAYAFDARLLPPRR